MTSDPSRSQIRNSISRTLFGHLTDGDWILTFLSFIAFLDYRVCVLFLENSQMPEVLGKVTEFTRSCRGCPRFSCWVTINFVSEPLIIASRPTWTFLQNLNSCRQLQLQCAPSWWNIFRFSSLFIIASCDLAQRRVQHYLQRNFSLTFPPANSPPYLKVIFEEVF